MEQRNRIVQIVMEVVEVVEMVSVRLVLEVQVSNEGVRKVHIDRRMTDGEETSSQIGTEAT
jgi:hypothetical protein